MFDALVRELASKFNLGGAAGPLVNAVLTYFFKSESGGLSAVLDRFRKAGMGDLVSSWIGSSAPRELTTGQLESALGGGLLEQLAGKAGLTLAQVKPALAFLVPKLVGLLTSDGKIPTGIPTAVSDWLSGPIMGSRLEPTRAVAGTPTFWKWLVPLLVLGALALWYLWPTTAMREPAPTAPRITGNGDLFPVKVYFPTASTALGPEDAARIGRAADYLKANPAAVVDVTGFADSTGGSEVNEEIAKERAQAVRSALVAAGIPETQAVLVPPASVTASGSDAEARRVEIRLRP